MIRQVRRLWDAAPIATILLALSLAAAGYFGVRTVAFWVYWQDPAHRQQQIEPWMSPGYVAHSWQVPRRVVTGAIGLADRPPKGGPRSLSDIAEERGVTFDDLATTLEDAIRAFHEDEDTARAADPADPDEAQP